MAFITTIVGLARSIGLRAVAEGVEDAGQCDQLTHLGCDRAEGFGPPRPLDGDARPGSSRPTRLATEVKQAS